MEDWEGIKEKRGRESGRERAEGKKVRDRREREREIGGKGKKETVRKVSKMGE